MSEQPGGPETAEQFVAAAEAVPGLVEGLRRGDTDALAEYFELASGAKVTSVTTREMAV